MIELLYGITGTTPVYLSGSDSGLKDQLISQYDGIFRPVPGFRTILFETRYFGGQEYCVYLQSQVLTKMGRGQIFLHIYAIERSKLNFDTMIPSILRGSFVTESEFSEVLKDPKKKRQWDPFTEMRSAAPLSAEDTLTDAQMTALLSALFKKKPGNSLCIVNRETDPAGYDRKCFSVLRQLYACLPVFLRQDLSFCTNPCDRSVSSSVLFCPDSIPANGEVVDLDAGTDGQSRETQLARLLVQKNSEEYKMFIALAEEAYRQEARFSLSALIQLFAVFKEAQQMSVKNLLDRAVALGIERQQSSAPEYLTYLAWTRQKASQEDLNSYLRDSVLKRTGLTLSRFCEEWKFLSCVIPEQWPRRGGVNAVPETELADVLEEAARTETVPIRGKSLSDYIQSSPCFAQLSRKLRQLPGSKAFPMGRILRGYISGRCRDAELQDYVLLWKQELRSDPEVLGTEDSENYRNFLLRHRIEPKLAEYLKDNSIPLSEQDFNDILLISESCPECVFPTDILEEQMLKAVGQCSSEEEYDEKMIWYSKLTFLKLDYTSASRQYLLRRFKMLKAQRVNIAQLREYAAMSKYVGQADHILSRHMNASLRDMVEKERKKASAVYEAARENAALDIKNAVETLNFRTQPFHCEQFAGSIADFPDLKAPCSALLTDRLLRELEASGVASQREMLLLQENCSLMDNAKILEPNDARNVRSAIEKAKQQCLAMDRLTACEVRQKLIDTALKNGETVKDRQKAQTTMQYLKDAVEQGNTFIEFNSLYQFREQVMAYQDLITAFRLSENKCTVYLRAKIKTDTIEFAAGYPHILYLAGLVFADADYKAEASLLSGRKLPEEYVKLVSEMLQRGWISEKVYPQILEAFAPEEGISMAMLKTYLAGKKIPTQDIFIAVLQAVKNNIPDYLSVICGKLKEGTVPNNTRRELIRGLYSLGEQRPKVLKLRLAQPSSVWKSRIRTAVLAVLLLACVAALPFIQFISDYLALVLKEKLVLNSLLELLALLPFALLFFFPKTDSWKDSVLYGLIICILSALILMAVPKQSRAAEIPEEISSSLAQAEETAAPAGAQDSKKTESLNGNNGAGSKTPEKKAADPGSKNGTGSSDTDLENQKPPENTAASGSTAEQSGANGSADQKSGKPEDTTENTAG